MLQRTHSGLASSFEAAVGRHWRWLVATPALDSLRSRVIHTPGSELCGQEENLNSKISVDALIGIRNNVHWA